MRCDTNSAGEEHYSCVEVDFPDAELDSAQCAGLAVVLHLALWMAVVDVDGVGLHGEGKIGEQWHREPVG